MDSREANISVVVPVYNEARALPSMVTQLEPLRSQCEVVFADGGSTDGTCDAVPPWITLVRTAKGRGVQLNAGAAAASGDILLFLHADCALPPDALRLVREVLAGNDLGFFGIRYDRAGWLLDACARQSNRRARGGIPFGDQGIFIWRSRFEQLGGFPDLPIMEDYQFSLDARAAGFSIGQASAPLVTSSRRLGWCFTQQLKTIAGMQVLRWLYRRGVEPAKLDRLYRDIR